MRFSRNATAATDVPWILAGCRLRFVQSSIVGSGPAGVLEVRRERISPAASAKPHCSAIPVDRICSQMPRMVRSRGSSTAESRSSRHVAHFASFSREATLASSSWTRSRSVSDSLMLLSAIGHTCLPRGAVSTRVLPSHPQRRCILDRKPTLRRNGLHSVFSTDVGALWRASFGRIDCGASDRPHPVTVECGQESKRGGRPGK